MKLAKEKMMPTWAGTKSLLLSHSSQSHGRTNTEVLALLFKTSPTDYGTLYTVVSEHFCFCGWSGEKNPHNTTFGSLPTCPPDSTISG